MSYRTPLRARPVAALALWACAAAAPVQELPQSRLADPKPLVAVEIGRLLERSKQALARKGFRVSGGLGGGEFQMDDQGRLGWSRQLGRAVGPQGETESIHITEFTYRPARRCDGSAGAGHLVVEYVHEYGRWRTRARQSRDAEVLAPVFKIWTLSAGIEDEGVREIAGRRARALRYPYEAPAGAAPELRGALQVLYFEIESRLPIRWELRTSNLPVVYFYDLLYDPALDVRPPKGLEPPECVMP